VTAHRGRGVLDAIVVADAAYRFCGAPLGPGSAALEALGLASSATVAAAATLAAATADSASLATVADVDTVAIADSASVATAADVDTAAAVADAFAPRRPCRRSSRCRGC